MNIFLDTAPLIYLLENHPDYSHKVKSYLIEQTAKDSYFQTSVITYMEFCVGPEKAHNEKTIEAFDLLLTQLGAIPVEINMSIAKLAAKLRAKYSPLKGMDSLQLAAAISLGCSDFFTNDKKLNIVNELQIIVVNEL